MKYIANGAVITNRILFTDGRRIDDIMGGGGFYAFTALRLCTKDSMLASGVGVDFDECYGEWFDKNECCRDGLIVKVDRTNYNELKYFPDGRYVEYSIYGEDYERENYPKTVLTPRELEPFVDDAKGLYYGSVIDDGTNAELTELKKGRGFKLMWEIPESNVDELGEIYKRGGINAVRDHMKNVDIFSCNKPESFRIFGTTTVEESIAQLKRLEMPVYFRVGSKGAYMIDRGEDYFVPMISSVAKELEIDPTGCGNTSTAAAMWAYCEGMDPLMCCVVGNVVASFNVRQYGPFVDMSDKSHEEMMSVCDRVYGEIKNG